MPRPISQLRADAQAIFRASLERVDARRAVIGHLSLDRNKHTLQIGADVHLRLSAFERVFVVGAGKAGAPMACAVEEVLDSTFQPQGLVNVKYGHTSPRPRFVALNECGHPLPDAAGAAGAREVADILEQLTERDLLFVVISGGASALLPAPAEGIELEEKHRTSELLLRAGATIDELNAVRKHLSTLKGGQLALRASPATVVALILSDVIGDRLDVIGSGPTAADVSTFSDAAGVLRKYDLEGVVPAAVMRRLMRGIRGEIMETPKQATFPTRQVHNIIVGSNRLAIDSAYETACALGYRTLILSSTMQGEAREVARVHVEILREAICSGSPIPLPACFLSGGETTVTVRGPGNGGRNQEFALAAAIAAAGLPNAVILAAGTDGTDGPTDAAGAMVDETTVARAMAMGYSPSDSLARNDSYPILDALGELLRPGPTGTNVMDLNIMLSDGDQAG
jgi:glycerate 2-kinase